MKIKYSLLLYALVGLLILLSDPTSAVVYFTILPIQIAFLYVALRSNNLVLIFVMAFVLFSVGFSSVTLYLTRFDRSDVGTANLGAFNFSLNQCFAIYIYVFIFLVSLTCFTLFFNKKKVLPHALDFARHEILTLSKKDGGYSALPLLITAICFTAISIWMYSMRIGIIGVFSDIHLPYSLNGILYYGRRFFFSLVLLYLFLRTKSKTSALVIFILYSIIVGVSGSSKSIAMLLLVPVAVYFYLVNKKIQCVVAIIFTVFIYLYVTGARELIFASNAEASLLDVFNTANMWTIALLQDPANILHYTNTFFHSFFGFDNTIVAYQYTKVSADGFIGYYTGTLVANVIPDIIFELYGFNLKGDMAYGICVGFIGTMVIMANHSYLLIVVEAIIISVIISIQNRAIGTLLSRKGDRIKKYLGIIILLFSMMSLFEANGLMSIYICTLLLMILSSGFFKKVF